MQTNDPAETSFLHLKNFIETRAAVAQALRLLETGVEIGVVIGDSIDCTLFIRDGKPQLERRAARSPDVVFSMRPETVEVLSERTTDDIGEIGVTIMKEMLAGQLSVRVEANVLDLLRRGYLRVAAAGGPAVHAFLARHGVTNVSGIMNTIKKMRQ